jgi:hypothetical protein
MIKLTPPLLTGTKLYIRNLATLNLPEGNTYWFEELPQIPFLLKRQNYTLETDSPGKLHQLFLNNKLFKTFTPDISPYNLLLALNAGIYDFTVVCGEDQTSGSFQVSIKEFFWQSWIYNLQGSFLDLEIIEGRFTNPFNLILLEITYPPDIINLSNSAWALRNFSQAASVQGIKGSFDYFASGLLQSNSIFSDLDFGLTDPQEEYSKLTLHFIHPTLARRGFFLQSKDSKVIAYTSWNMADIQEIDDRNLSLSLDILGSITIHSNILGSYVLRDSEGSLLTFPLNPGIGYNFTLTNLVAGYYTIISEYIPNYIIPEPYKVLLSDGEDFQVSLLYILAPTTITIIIPSNAPWELSSGPITLIGIGGQTVDIQTYFDDGYLVWTLTIDDTR